MSDERCPKCGKPSASPPAEVYCVDCATEGWERDAIEHLRFQLERAETERNDAGVALIRVVAELERVERERDEYTKMAEGELGGLRAELERAQADAERWHAAWRENEDEAAAATGEIKRSTHPTPCPRCPVRAELEAELERTEDNLNSFRDGLTKALNDADVPAMSSWQKAIQYLVDRAERAERERGEAIGGMHAAIDGMQRAERDRNDADEVRRSESDKRRRVEAELRQLKEKYGNN